MTTEIESVRDRMKLFLTQEGISEGAFEVVCGLARGYVSSIGDTIRRSTLKKITDKYPNLDVDWLLYNRPTLSKSSISPYLTTKSGILYKDLGNGRYQMTVPFVPHKAYAKYLNEAVDIDYEEYKTYDFIVDKIGLGKYLAFEIKGDSMDDDSRRAFVEGDVVLARDLSKDFWKDKLRYEKYNFWIIVTNDSILCKQIINHDVEKGIITCHSLSKVKEYSDFTLNLNEVKKLYNIIQRVSFM